MILASIAEYIQENMSGFAAGTTLFVNQALEGQYPMMLLRDSSGGFKIDGEIPTERTGRFQLVVRGDDEETLIEAANEVSLLLTAQGLDLGDYLVKVIRPLHEPVMYQRSEGSKTELSVNFSVTYGIVA